MIWKDVAPQLASRGYRVLLYDLYGRGYSDAPQTKYDATLYATQLALLMQHLKWDKAFIAGVSMGGGITAAFTAFFPSLVEDRICLIASAGVMQSGDISRTAKMMSSPFVQAMAGSHPVRTYLQHLLNSTENPQRGSSDPVVEIVRLQSALLPGYNGALSSSLRDGPIRGLEHAFSGPGFQGRSVLLIHGTKDRTVAYAYAPRILSLLPTDTRNRSRLVTVEDGRHDLTISHPELIVDSLVEFLEEK
ncbi:hypothetical protein AX16_003917 [Volvariella volvacea WC 439]|nr:hypothetical protein AX16_003917 [Volvariella volvacea WC 439]